MSVFSPGTPSGLIWRPWWTIFRSSKASFIVLIGLARTMAFSNASNKSFLLQPSIAVPSKAVKAARLLTRSGFVANLGSVPKCPILTISQIVLYRGAIPEVTIIPSEIVVKVWYGAIFVWAFPSYLDVDDTVYTCDHIGKGNAHFLQRTIWFTSQTHDAWPPSDQEIIASPTCLGPVLPETCHRTVDQFWMFIL